MNSLYQISRIITIATTTGEHYVFTNIPVYYRYKSDSSNFPDFAHYRANAQNIKEGIKEIRDILADYEECSVIKLKSQIAVPELIIPVSKIDTIYIEYGYQKLSVDDYSVTQLENMLNPSDYILMTKDLTIAVFTGLNTNAGIPIMSAKDIQLGIDKIVQKYIVEIDSNKNRDELSYPYEYRETDNGNVYMVAEIKEFFTSIQRDFEIFDNITNTSENIRKVLIVYAAPEDVGSKILHTDTIEYVVRYPESAKESAE